MRPGSAGVVWRAAVADGWRGVAVPAPRRGEALPELPEGGVPELSLQVGRGRVDVLGVGGRGVAAELGPGQTRDERPAQPGGDERREEGKRRWS